MVINTTTSTTTTTTTIVIIIIVIVIIVVVVVTQLSKKTTRTTAPSCIMQVIHANFLLKKKKKKAHKKQNLTFTLFSLLLFQVVNCPTLTVSSLVCGTVAGLKNEFVLNQACTGFEPFTTTITAQWSAYLPLTSFSLILHPAIIYQ